MRIEGMVPPVEPIKEIKLDEKPKDPYPAEQSDGVENNLQPRPKDHEPGKGEIIDTYA